MSRSIRLPEIFLSFQSGELLTRDVFGNIFRFGPFLNEPLEPTQIKFHTSHSIIKLHDLCDLKT